MDFLHHCIQLAQQAQGRVGNGALVGSVLVRGEEMIAEGWHKEYGKPHAEAEIIEQINCSNIQIQPEDVLYVNLEPCCHQGKTPPCTQAIIDSGIQNVVIGMLDPDPRVQGKGVEALRRTGIIVAVSKDTAQCHWLNRGYVSLRERNRPWITLKKAQTSDGSIANDDGSPLQITSPEQDAWSHMQLRAKHDAIVVGVGTIISDDPQLTIRGQQLATWQPLRIVLDPHLRIPLEARVMGEDMASGTMIVCDEAKNLDAEAIQKLETLQFRGVHIIHVPLNGAIFDWDQLWQKLCTPEGDYHGITSILVEGGGQTWETFEESGNRDMEVVLVGR